jgi:metal-responsive CopG/Arc/MetJ family transcriptional regulator
MVNQMISLRLPKNMLDNIHTISQDKGYASLQEFIKEAIRNQIDVYEKQKRIDAFLKLKAKNPSIKTKKEVSEFIEKMYS